MQELRQGVLGFSEYICAQKAQNFRPRPYNYWPRLRFSRLQSTAYSIEENCSYPFQSKKSCLEMSAGAINQISIGAITARPTYITLDRG